MKRKPPILPRKNLKFHLHASVSERPDLSSERLQKLHAPWDPASLLRAAKIILKFPKTLFACSFNLWHANVIDLPEETYCIIDRIHFVEASAAVAPSLEKGRTYHREMKFLSAKGGETRDHMAKLVRCMRMRRVLLHPRVRVGLNVRHLVEPRITCNAIRCVGCVMLGSLS
ncbi:hypothetical protein PMIN06_001339 [Paraphaeosphaeria minitans]